MCVFFLVKHDKDETWIEALPTADELARLEEQIKESCDAMDWTFIQVQYSGLNSNMGPTKHVEKHGKVWGYFRSKDSLSGSYDFMMVNVGFWVSILSCDLHIFGFVNALNP